MSRTHAPLAAHARLAPAARAALALAFAAGAGAAAGCAPSIRPDPSDRPDASLVDSSIDGVAPTGLVTTKQWPDGSFTTVIDATSLTEWIHVDFAARAEAMPAGTWDLRYQRFHISANGGITGTRGVEVAPLPARALAEVTAVPQAGWLTDAPDGADANVDPDYAFEQGDGWYSYNMENHQLTPRSLIWVVRSPGRTPIKIAIERYYDAAGTPGWITLHWASL